jgi:hypothetical protein
MLPPSLIAYNIMLSRLKIPLVGTMYFPPKNRIVDLCASTDAKPPFYGFTVEDEYE